MQGKVAIVTGASSGIGRAAAQLFADRGVNVVAVGRNEKSLKELKKSASKKGGIMPHLADVTEFSQLDRVVADSVDHFGKIDVLVNCAGILKNGNIENTSLDDWDRIININL